MEKGVPIRSITRSVAVLQAVNRYGELSLMEISRRAAIPYPTACRIVQTLVLEGMLWREPITKKYRPTALVQSLSNGFQAGSRLVAVAREPIVSLTKLHGWPVSLATRVGKSMVIRDSTHALTPMTFNIYYPGYTLPILDSASGKAYLAHADDIERELIIRDILSGDDAPDDLTKLWLDSGDMIEDIRKLGYAVKGRNQFTDCPGRTSSLARPVFDNNGVVGSIVLIFFSTSMRVTEAVAKYDDDLHRTADEITSRLIMTDPDRENILNFQSPAKITPYVEARA